MLSRRATEPAKQPTIWIPGKIVFVNHHHYHHMLFPSQYGNNRYSAITYRIIEVVGCQKSKCSPSWPPIITLICIVNIQHIHTDTQYTNDNTNKW